jgi:hypothetical protein
VNVGTGVALIAAGGVGVLVTAFVLRTLLPSVAVAVLLAACSVAVGAGALGVQEHAGTADWVVTLGSLAVLGPAHVRIVLGPFGRRGAGAAA